MAKWHKTKEELPPVNDKFCESDELLCVESGMGSVPFVGWYNKKLEQWFVSYHDCPSIPKNVSHWRELPPKPRGL